jgi:hypothetical protein
MFDLDRDCIFNRSSDFCPKMAKGRVCNWLHSVGQNHFYVMMHLNRDLAIQKSPRRFYTVYKSEKSNPL